MHRRKKSAKRRLLDEIIWRYRNRVRECRLKAMVARQDDLAKMTGINHCTISGIENNRIFLSAAHALLIAEALGCKLDDLYEKLGQG